MPKTPTELEQMFAVFSGPSDLLPPTHPEGQHRMQSVEEGSRCLPGVASETRRLGDLRL
jgi:hypothetical protein